MKLLDFAIAALTVGCMFVGYAGHRVIAILLLLLVVITASWRFWDRAREKELMDGHASGELNPELDHWADLSDDSGDSGGDSGGHE